MVLYTINLHLSRGFSKKYLKIEYYCTFYVLFLGQARFTSKQASISTRFYFSALCISSGRNQGERVLSHRTLPHGI